MASAEANGVDERMEAKVTRMSLEQRQVMLNFMKEHPALCTGRFVAPDGAKHKARLLKELSVKLNSCPNGATKPEEKWLKSWQDWRSDTKAKAAKVKRHANGTGGGPPLKLSLTPLEEELLTLIGAAAVSGHAAVSDPLEVTAVPSTSAPTLHPAETTHHTILWEQVTADTLLMPLADETETSVPLSVPVPVLTPTESESGSSSSSYSASAASSSKTPSNMRKHARSESLSISDPEDSKLLKLSEEQIRLEKEKVALTREQVQLQRDTLDLLRQESSRRTVAFETVAGAIVGAMQSFQDYIKVLADQK